MQPRQPDQGRHVAANEAAAPHFDAQTRTELSQWLLPADLTRLESRAAEWLSLSEERRAWETSTEPAALGRFHKLKATAFELQQQIEDSALLLRHAGVFSALGNQAGGGQIPPGWGPEEGHATAQRLIADLAGLRALAAGAISALEGRKGVKLTFTRRRQRPEPAWYALASQALWLVYWAAQDRPGDVAFSKTYAGPPCTVVRAVVALVGIELTDDQARSAVRKWSAAHKAGKTEDLIKP